MPGNRGGLQKGEQMFRAGDEPDKPHAKSI